MTRSLVVAPQWIGDAVMTQPLLASLAGRGERLSVAALPWVAPVYRAMPEVVEVLELPFAHGRLDWSLRRRLAAEMRGRFDRAYVLPNSIKAALIPWLARIPVRVGYHGEGRPLLLNRRLPNPGGRPPMVAFYSALSGAGRATGSPSPERPPFPRLVVGAGAVQEATAALGVQGNGYWVFAPGAEYGPAKCWPADHYAALATSLHRQHGQPVVLLGSAKESALCEQISQAAPGACIVAAGKTNLLHRHGVDCRRAGHGEQRLGADARGGRLCGASGGSVWLHQPGAHAAAEPARARDLAQAGAGAGMLAVF